MSEGNDTTSGLESTQSDSAEGCTESNCAGCIGACHCEADFEKWCEVRFAKEECIRLQAKEFKEMR